MPLRQYAIPTVALSVTGLTSCGPKADDDDDDYSDIPILGEDSVPGSGGSDGSGGTDGGTDPVDGSGEDTLLGSWSLLRIDGIPWEYGYSYSYGDCTYTYAPFFTITLEEAGDDSFSGDAEFGYAYTFEGDCDRESYTYSDRFPARGQREAERRYTVDVPDMGLYLDCSLRSSDLDQMDCDYDGLTLEFER